MKTIVKKKQNSTKNQKNSPSMVVSLKKKTTIKQEKEKEMAKLHLVSLKKMETTREKKERKEIEQERQRAVIMKNISENKFNEQKREVVNHHKRRDNQQTEKAVTEQTDLSSKTEISTKEENTEFLLSWKAVQFEDVPRHRYWYLTIFILLIFLLAYGLFFDNFLLGIIAVLSGLVIYLFEKKDPQLFKFGITHEGVFIHDHLKRFSELEDFLIFYEPGPQGRKELSIKSQKHFVPFIHIPLGKADPVEVRKLLVPFLDEEEHEETLIDALYRWF